METIEVSKCCLAEPIEDHRTDWRDHHNQIDIYTCSKCKNECEVEEVCAFCLGDGEVSTDETDSDGNVMQGVGTQKCVCRIDEEEYDEDERY